MIFLDIPDASSLFGLPIRFPRSDKNPKRISAKEQFINHLQNERIKNEKHFQTYLSESSEFASIIPKLYPSQLETLKKNIFQINRQRLPQITYEEAIKDIELIGCSTCKGVLLCDECFSNEDLIVAFGTLSQIIYSIANENRMSVSDLLSSLYGILEGKYGKRNAIILIGSSDSGKSTLADILSSPYKDYQIGNFKVPLKNCNNTFWLENLPGTELYRCEECILESVEVIQIMKSLLEGNPNLETEMKYKSPIQVPRRPVIITMNGHQKEDVTKLVSSEFNAFQNRSTIIVMNKPLRDRINDGDIGMLKKYASYINRVLWEKFGNVPQKKQDIVTIDFCNSFSKELLQ